MLCVSVSYLYLLIDCGDQELGELFLLLQSIPLHCPQTVPNKCPAHSRHYADYLVSEWTFIILYESASPIFKKTGIKKENMPLNCHGERDTKLHYAMRIEN